MEWACGSRTTPRSSPESLSCVVGLPVRRRPRRLLAAGLLAGLLSAAPPARAEGDPPAQDLVAAARADMDAGRYATACPALMSSYRTLPAALTLYYLASCEDKAGLTASAWIHYGEYVQSFDQLPADAQKEQRPFETTAAERRKALEPSLPRLTVTLPPSAPFGTKILRKSAQGATIEIPAGVPLPIDPGDHVLMTETPRGKVKEQRLTIKSAEQRSLVAEVVAGPDDPPPARYAPEVPPLPLVLPPEEKPASSLRRAAYVLGGAGIGALVIGIAGGAVVLSQKSTVEENCVDRYCNRKGQSAADTARVGGTLANVAFPVGLALLTAGVGLYLAEPAPPKLGAAPARFSLRLSVDPSGAVLGARGDF